MPADAFVFDAYGTLYDVHSVAARCESCWPGKGAQVSQLWRAKQLEYTWQRSLMQRYAPFSTVTRDALAYACEVLKLEISAAQTEGLMAEYLRLALYPEAKGALPPGSPAVMKRTGEIWIAADRYTQYAPMAFRSNSGLASLGMTKLLREGLVLRSVLRSPSFGGKEIETIVTSIAEEPAPANAFEIPAGYKLVPGGGQV